VSQQRVREELERGNPWYVGDQFAWAEKPGIRRIYENRRRFIQGCIDRARGRLGRPLRLLDLGCGDGYWLRQLSEIVDLELWGLDSNPVRIERARVAAPRANLACAALEDLTPSRAFDVILLSQVIEHVPDDAALLRRISSLLVPEGTLVLGTTNEGCWLQYRNFRDAEARSRTDHVHFYREAEITAKIRDASFRIEAILREPFYFFTDSLYYRLIASDWGFRLLEILTAICPSQCTDYYFECRKPTPPP
jgi:2-polyprenyl-3-methyl-5-hydroxy-6-metoxy-1,4-benzoquinol methylase